jgi:VWFA-related protein
MPRAAHAQPTAAAEEITLPSTSKSLPVVLLLAAAAGLCVATAQAPRPPEPPAPLPSSLIERVEVRFVSFDLIVERRGRGGWRVVRDLRREKVTVLVGGEPVALEMFEPHCDPAAGALVAAGGGPDGQTAAKPQSVDSPATAAGGGEVAVASDLAAAPIRYILYFDLSQITNEGVNMAYKAALDWAAGAVKPNDEVMIVNGGEVMRLVRPFLPASQRLREDILAARQATTRIERPAEFEGSRVREIDELFAVLRRKAPPEARALAYAEEDLHRTRNSLSSLQALMTLFDGIEGPKNLLLFQNRLRQIPGSEYPFADLRYVSAVDADLQQVARAANEREVRIYGVHAEGLESPRDSPQPNASDAITFLASETGGRVVERTNTLTPIFDRVAEDASCFYRVGFPAPREHSGKAERIEVRIGDGRGIRVRHRRTLDDPTREALQVDSVRAALLAPESAVAIALSTAAWPLWWGANGGRTRLEVRVPLAGLVALPGTSPENREAKVQLGLTLVPLRPLEPGETRRAGSPWTEAAGDRLPWSTARQSALTLPAGWSAATDPREIVLTQEVDAPPGDYRLLAVVQDRVANAVGSALADLTIPEAAVPLGPIHLAADDARALPAVRTAEEDEAEPNPRRKNIRAADPSLPDRTRLLRDTVLVAGSRASALVGLCDPQPRSARKRDDAAQASLIGWTLRRTLSCSGAAAPLASSEAPLPAADADGCALLVDPLPSDALVPGPCVYEVTLERPGEAPLSRRLEFRIE